MSDFQERIRLIFLRFGEITLDVSCQETLAALEQSVLDCYAEEVKEQKQKLQHFYENFKGNIEVDEKSGYYVSKERKELLKIVVGLLEEEKPTP
jgi:hypothetical protein